MQVNHVCRRVWVPSIFIGEGGGKALAYFVGLGMGRENCWRVEEEGG